MSQTAKLRVRLYICAHKIYSVIYSTNVKQKVTVFSANLLGKQCQLKSLKCHFVSVSQSIIGFANFLFPKYDMVYCFDIAVLQNDDNRVAPVPTEASTTPGTVVNNFNNVIIICTLWLTTEISRLPKHRFHAKHAVLGTSC